MRHWEPQRTRSKVMVLLLVNLAALLGGKYTALITIFPLGWFGDAIAYAKASKKKLPKPPLSAVRGDHPPPPATTRKPATLHGKHRGQPALSHVIRRGQTLSTIAEAYGISVDALRRANRLPSTSHIIVGERLRIPAREGAPTNAESHQRLPSTDRTLFLGVQRHLARRMHTSVKSSQSFSWPVRGLLTSPFGEREHVMGGGGTRFHAGIDLSVPTGTPVQASKDGIVAFAGDNGAYGKAVKLDHPHGYSTLYAHNSRILVHVGQIVKAGQVICLSGSTGRSTGPHLHFEVHKGGLPVDPLAYLQ
ncbi:MAG TPA: M23 family metallopeptidase [Candidatus Tectomicrobia bacterium]|nr:M23 family metallopeptidase [Candidatus Tectomicrobia bacterium]